MKTTLMMTLCVLSAAGIHATAQDQLQRPKRPLGPPPPEVLEKFDKDGDGKLSDDERKAMREAMHTRMGECREEILEKFDTDKDGKLSPEERATARESFKAEMLGKYDKDGDGQLSKEERTAIPKPPGRPGGPQVRQGFESSPPAGE